MTFTLSFMFPLLFRLGIILFFSLWLLALTDGLILFFFKGMTGSRILPEKLSNGDQNQIRIELSNRFPFWAKVKVLDELPFQFQSRDTVFKLDFPPGSHQTINYSLQPVERGVYEFGILNVFVQSPVRLISRRFRLGQPQQVPVYPSFIQMRNYELMAVNHDLHQFGLKRIRKIGQH